MDLFVLNPIDADEEKFQTLAVFEDSAVPWFQCSKIFFRYLISYMYILVGKELQIMYFSENLCVLFSYFFDCELAFAVLYIFICFHELQFLNLLSQIVNIFLF